MWDSRCKTCCPSATSSPRPAPSLRRRSTASSPELPGHQYNQDQFKSINRTPRKCKGLIWSEGPPCDRHRAESYSHRVEGEALCSRARISLSVEGQVTQINRISYSAGYHCNHIIQRVTRFKSLFVCTVNSQFHYAMKVLLCMSYY